MSADEDIPTVAGYVDLERIGVGGFSTVFAATEVAFQRRVALKVVDATGSEARRFQREVLALGAMADIPHVVHAYSVAFTSDGRPVLVMPLMPGSLAGLIAQHGAVPIDRVVKWAGQLGLALDEAHRRGIVHRDIKPENVLISAYDDAALVDFGIATLDAMTAATATSMSLSPPHAAPERFVGADESPRAGDIYSFASTLYAAVCGRPPFGTAADGGVLGLASRVAHSPVPPIDGVSVGVNAALARGLAKLPSDRPATARSLVDGLVAATRDDVSPVPTPAPPPIPANVAPPPFAPGAAASDPGDTVLRPEPVAPPTVDPAVPARLRRRPVLAAGLAALLVAAGAILAIRAITDDDSSSAAPDTTRARPTTTAAPTATSEPAPSTVATSTIDTSPPRSAAPLLLTQIADHPELTEEAISIPTGVEEMAAMYPIDCRSDGTTPSPIGCLERADRQFASSDGSFDVTIYLARFETTSQPITEVLALWTRFPLDNLGKFPATTDGLAGAFWSSDGPIDQIAVPEATVEAEGSQLIGGEIATVTAGGSVGEFVVLVEVTRYRPTERDAAFFQDLVAATLNAQAANIAAG